MNNQAFLYNTDPGLWAHFAEKYPRKELVVVGGVVSSKGHYNFARFADDESAHVVLTGVGYVFRGAGRYSIPMPVLEGHAK